MEGRGWGAARYLWLRIHQGGMTWIMVHMAMAARLKMATAVEKLASLDLSDIGFLVVDDNEFVRRLLYEILLGFGAAHVRQAGSTAEALDALKFQEPDIIITDWVMPGSSGLDLLRSLRAGGGATRIPVIVLSGHATSDYVSQALGEGADSYIVKPFSPQTVMDHLLKVIAHSDKAAAYV